MGPGALEPTLTSREYVWEKECAASFHLQVFIFWGGVDSGRGWWGGGCSQAMSWQVGKRQTWTCLYPRPLRVLRCKGGVWCSSHCHLKPSPAESGCKTSRSIVQLILTKCATTAVKVCLNGVIRQTRCYVHLQLSYSRYTRSETHYQQTFSTELFAVAEWKPALHCFIHNWHHKKQTKQNALRRFKSKAVLCQCALHTLTLKKNNPNMLTSDNHT